MKLRYESTGWFKTVVEKAICLTEIQLRSIKYLKKTFILFKIRRVQPLAHSNKFD